MKKIMNTLLIALTVISMVGCTNHFKYLGNVQDYSVNAQGYTMKVPENNEVKRQYNSDIFETEVEKQKITFIVSSNVNPEEVSKYLDLENIAGYFNYDRLKGLNTIVEELKENIEFKNDYKEITVHGFKTLKDSGDVQLSQTVTMNYVSYEFFGDKENKVPFEVFVCSEVTDINTLSNVAEELISTVKKGN